MPVRSGLAGSPIRERNRRASIKRDHMAMAVIGGRILRHPLTGGNPRYFRLSDGHRVGMGCLRVHECPMK
jgi:hypothetical protein